MNLTFLQRISPRRLLPFVSRVILPFTFLIAIFREYEFNVNLEDVAVVLDVKSFILFLIVFGLFVLWFDKYREVKYRRKRREYKLPPSLLEYTGFDIEKYIDPPSDDESDESSDDEPLLDKSQILRFKVENGVQTLQSSPSEKRSGYCYYLMSDENDNKVKVIDVEIQTEELNICVTDSSVQTGGELLVDHTESGMQTDYVDDAIYKQSSVHTVTSVVAAVKGEHNFNIKPKSDSVSVNDDFSGSTEPAQKLVHADSSAQYIQPKASEATSGNDKCSSVVPEMNPSVMELNLDGCKRKLKQNVKQDFISGSPVDNTSRFCSWLSHNDVLRSVFSQPENLTGGILATALVVTICLKDRKGN